MKVKFVSRYGEIINCHTICDFEIGITMVSEDDRSRYICCLNERLSSDKTHYKKVFDSIEKQLNEGVVSEIRTIVEVYGKRINPIYSEVGEKYCAFRG